jgi:hypothetical protein
MSYYFISIKLSALQKRKDSRCWLACGEKGTLIQCWWYCKLVEVILENSVEVVQKTKGGISIWIRNLTFEYIYIQGNWSKYSMRCLHFHEALFTIVKIWKQSAHQWMNGLKMKFIHTAEYYPTIVIPKICHF